MNTIDVKASENLLFQLSVSEETITAGSTYLLVATTFDNNPKSFLKSEDITHFYKKASFFFFFKHLSVPLTLSCVNSALTTTK